jgi:hypothetical protein
MNATHERSRPLPAEKMAVFLNVALQDNGPRVITKWRRASW